MDTNHLKFVSIPDAIEEIKTTLLMQSEFKMREELEPILRLLEDLQVRKDTKKVHPLDFVSRDGLWIKFQESEKFYYGIDLVEFFLDLLSSKPAETISRVYSEIEWVLVETEMEKFMCVQCGHCCLDLSGAYQTSVPETDIKRWEREQRFDILEWVGPFEGMDEIWISPRTGEYVNRCPWLRKLPKQNKYICRIHGTKPEHCRNFPKSKRHALDNDCKGFPTE